MSSSILYATIDFCVANHGISLLFRYKNQWFYTQSDEATIKADFEKLRKKQFLISIFIQIV